MHKDYDGRFTVGELLPKFTEELFMLVNRKDDWPRLARTLPGVVNQDKGGS